MPRSGMTHVGVSDSTKIHQQMNSGAGNTAQVLALERDCVAVMLSARTANAYVTFSDDTPSSSEGLEIVAGAQPVFIPLGYHSHGAHNLRMIGAAANCILNVLQLA